MAPLIEVVLETELRGCPAQIPANPPSRGINSYGILFISKQSRWLFRFCKAVYPGFAWVDCQMCYSDLLYPFKKYLRLYFYQTTMLTPDPIFQSSSYPFLLLAHGIASNMVHKSKSIFAWGAIETCQLFVNIFVDAFNMGLKLSRLLTKERFSFILVISSACANRG